MLVVYKKTALQRYVVEHRDATLRRLLQHGHPDAEDLRRSDAVHRRALDTVVATLKTLGVVADLAARRGLQVSRRYDLVVSVGGDGTFLQAARAVGSTPILGVNSDPARSEAVFSAANAATFPRVLRLALDGRLQRLELIRLGLVVNGRRVPERAVNDILLAHDHPATMTRYRLTIGRRTELQKSSGLWVATAAGSSSAVLAAGGVRLPWGSRRFQYRPRELYEGRLSRYRLRGGVLPGGAVLRMTWLMRQGAAFFDGPHVEVRLRFADELEIGVAPDDPLVVLGLNGER